MKYSNAGRHIWLPLIVAAAIVAGVLLGRSLPGARISVGTALLRSAPSTALADDKLYQVLTRIYGQYVDEPRMDSVQEKVIPQILESLDPHSAYIPASLLARVNEPLEGQFDGIGVTFNMFEDTVRIIHVITGGPSYKAGLLNGDRIITVDDSVVSGRNVDQNDVVKMLRGQRGTKVELGVERQGVSDLLPVTVTRGVIPLKSVDAAFMVTPRTGYIRLSLFSRSSHQEVVQTALDMKGRGMRNLILDLRGNSGGLLDQAIYIANEFLPKDALIVYTEGRVSHRRNQYSDGKGRLQDIYPILLIDEGSASASEIVAGALQDNDRGTIIGRRSFGKGLVQEQMELGDGSAIRLTVARYYTPVGRSIQKPYHDGIDEYNRDMEIRYQHSELFTADSIRFADSLKFTTFGGKEVYGGGGIMPDIFVPLDTTEVSRYAVQVINRNLLLHFTNSYSDHHRDELNAITDFPQLESYFAAREGLLNELVRYAASRGVRPGPKDLDEAGPLLAAYLKAYIGRNTPLEDHAFYYYLLPLDPVYNRTILLVEEMGGRSETAAAGQVETDKK